MSLRLSPRPHLMGALFLVGLGLAFAPACSADDGSEETKKDDNKGGDLTPAPFTFRSGGAAIANGGDFHIPGNDVGQKVAPWKDASEPFTIDNDGDSTVTLTDIAVESSEDAPSEAFTVVDADGKPLSADGTQIKPGAKMTFYIHFQPVSSGLHTATIVIKYGDGKVFKLKVSGAGAAGLDLGPLPQPDLARLVGSAKADEMTSTMVVDAKGAAWVSANVRGLVDADNYDILVAHMTAEGTLGWARVLNGAYRDFSPDDGGNSETGGVAGSLSLGGGDVFAVGASSTTKTNAKFKAVITRLKGTDGATVWAKTYEPEAGAKALTNSALAYAIDATADPVLVTGKTQGGVMLLALAPKDGKLVYAKALTIVAGATEVGHAIASDGKGGAWIGGRSDTRAFLAHITDVAGSPAIGWAGILEVGAETRVNHIAVDPSGDAIVTLGQGGAKTAFAAARVAQDGKLGWAVRFPGIEGNLAQAHALTVAGGAVWLGGRIGLAGFDGVKGDGLLLELAAEDGKLRKAAVHWAGPEAAREVEHRVKALAVAGSRLFVAEQAFTGDSNKLRYRGYWYATDVTVEAFAPDVTTKADGTLEDETKGAVDEASAMILNKAAPDALVLVPSKAKVDGEAPDADVLISRIALP